MAVVCEVSLARLVEYLTGQLGEDKRFELEAHIGTGCKECAERISALGGVVTKMVCEKCDRVV